MKFLFPPPASQSIEVDGSFSCNILGILPLTPDFTDLLNQLPVIILQHSYVSSLKQDILLLSVPCCKMRMFLCIECI